MQAEYDDVREEGVKDLAEILLEYRAIDESGFNEITDSLDEHRTIIGKGEDCSGSYGVQCADSVTNNHCLDIGEITQYGSEPLPIDPSSATYSSLNTGYALTKKENELIVLSCNPEAKSNIELRIQLNN